MEKLKIAGSIESSSDEKIKKIEEKIKMLEEEKDYVEWDEVPAIQKEIETLKQKVKLLKESKLSKVNRTNKSNSGRNEKVVKDTISDPYGDIEKLNHPENIENKLKEWVSFLKEVNIKPWELKYISHSVSQKGISVYGFFWYKKNRVKVRLSDHGGRWSGQDLFLKNPKNKDGIEKYLKSLNIAQKS